MRINMEFIWPFHYQMQFYHFFNARFVRTRVRRVDWYIFCWNWVRFRRKVLWILVELGLRRNSCVSDSAFQLKCFNLWEWNFFASLQGVCELSVGEALPCVEAYEFTTFAMCWVEWVLVCDVVGVDLCWVRIFLFWT